MLKIDNDEERIRRRVIPQGGVAVRCVTVRCLSRRQPHGRDRATRPAGEMNPTSDARLNIVKGSWARSRTRCATEKSRKRCACITFEAAEVLPTGPSPIDQCREPVDYLTLRNIDLREIQAHSPARSVLARRAEEHVIRRSNASSHLHVLAGRVQSSDESRSATKKVNGYWRRTVWHGRGQLARIVRLESSLRCDEAAATTTRVELLAPAWTAPESIAARHSDHGVKMAANVRRAASRSAYVRCAEDLPGPKLQRGLFAAGARVIRCARNGPVRTTIESALAVFVAGEPRAMSSFGDERP